MTILIDIATIQINQQGWFTIHFRDAFPAPPTVLALIIGRHGAPVAPRYEAPTFSIPPAKVPPPVSVPAISIPTLSIPALSIPQVTIPRLGRGDLAATYADYGFNATRDILDGRWDGRIPDWGLFNWIRDAIGSVGWVLGWIAGAIGNLLWDSLIQPQIDRVQSALNTAIATIQQRVQEALNAIITQVNQLSSNIATQVNNGANAAITATNNALRGTTSEINAALAAATQNFNDVGNLLATNATQVINDTITTIWNLIGLGKGMVFAPCQVGTITEKEFQVWGLGDMTICYVALAPELATILNKDEVTKGSLAKIPLPQITRGFKLPTLSLPTRTTTE